MIPIELLQSKLPLIEQWIVDILMQHASQAKSLSSFGFLEIPKYFSQETIASIKVVIVPKVPMPPLTQMGLSQFGDFEKGSYAGVTYLDTYFLISQVVNNEATHFHELCHVIQWKYLGIDKFLIAYALGLMQHGYRNSPLEAMAYEYQQLFERRLNPFNIEAEIKNKLRKLGDTSGF